MFQTHRDIGGKSNKEGREEKGKEKKQGANENILVIYTTNNGLISSIYKELLKSVQKRQLKRRPDDMNSISQNKITQWPLDMKGWAISHLIG